MKFEGWRFWKARQDRYQELTTVAKQLEKDERYRAAWAVRQKLADEFGDLVCGRSTNWPAVLTAAWAGAVPDLLEEDSVSAKAVAGHLLWSGYGCRADPDRAELLIREAAQQGHPLAMFDLATRVGPVVARDFSNSTLRIQRLEAAAEAGSLPALFFLGEFYWESLGTRARGLLYFLKFHCVQQGWPLWRAYYIDNIASTPFGYWIPDCLFQSLVMDAVASAQHEWMLVANRKRLPKYVALLIAAFICTKGTEWEKFRATREK